MIHQLIFANPRPGMSAKDFQDYWINVHAKNFASKIPQIKKYKVSRVTGLNSKPVFNGMAEIWLENGEEQLASLQSPEFVKGARADEPNWAAFWESLGLDTQTRPIIEAPDGFRHKLVILVKRAGGVPLEMFRNYAIDTAGNLIRKIKGAKAACFCQALDGLYSVGESRFDGAFQIWYEGPYDPEDGRPLALDTELRAACAPNGLFYFVCEENVII